MNSSDKHASQARLNITLSSLDIQPICEDTNEIIQ